MPVLSTLLLIEAPAKRKKQPDEKWKEEKSEDFSNEIIRGAVGNRSAGRNGLTNQFN